MARGWESKSVEDQIDAAAAKRTERATPSTTPAERELIARRSTLLLARTKTLKDLGAARDPRYRAILERALAELDAQLTQLEPGDQSRRGR